MRSLRWILVLFVGFGCLAFLGSVTTAEEGTTTESGTSYCKLGEPCPQCLAAKGAVLCGKCGHEQGSEECCSDKCETCSKCGLHAGSTLCCKVDADSAGADICASCGHVASETCCDDDCETCEKCGLHADSALCCKLTPCADCSDGELCPRCMAATDIVLCGSCGHVKGGEECCSDDCERCDKCGLHAGSILCCRLNKGDAGTDLCTKCGHAAGSDECCADDCEVCQECGLHTGSPLCCKLIHDEG